MAQTLLGALMLADVVAINMGVSLALGSLASDEWLRNADSPWSDAVRTRGTAVRRVGTAVTLLGLICAVWLQAAVMREAPLLEAGPTAWVLLRDTHFGHVALAGMVSWCVLTAASWRAAPHERARLGFIGLGLAVLVWSRSAVAHAGSQGDFSFDVANDGAHLLAACLWVGIVLFAASVRLRAIGVPVQQRIDATQWVAALSSTATVALVVVVLTGSYKIWRNGTSVTALVTSDYGMALGSKLALVALAAALGGFNRFRILPALFVDLRADVGDAVPRPWRRRLKTVLCIEALALLLVLVAAAVLAGTEPPNP